MTQPIPDLDLGDIPAIVRPGTAPKPEPKPAVTNGIHTNPADSEADR